MAGDKYDMTTIVFDVSGTEFEAIGGLFKTVSVCASQKMNYKLYLELELDYAFGHRLPHTSKLETSV